LTKYCIWCCRKLKFCSLLSAKKQGKLYKMKDQESTHQPLVHLSRWSGRYVLHHILFVLHHILFHNQYRFCLEQSFNLILLSLIRNWVRKIGNSGIAKHLMQWTRTRRRWRNTTNLFLQLQTRSWKLKNKCRKKKSRSACSNYIEYAYLESLVVNLVVTRNFLYTSCKENGTIMSGSFLDLKVLLPISLNFILLS